MENANKILSKGSFKTKLSIQSDNQDVEIELTNNGRKQKVIDLQWNTRFDTFFVYTTTSVWLQDNKWRKFGSFIVKWFLKQPT